MPKRRGSIGKGHTSVSDTSSLWPPPRHRRRKFPEKVHFVNLSKRRSSLRSLEVKRETATKQFIILHSGDEVGRRGGGVLSMGINAVKAVSYNSHVMYNDIS